MKRNEFVKRLAAVAVLGIPFLAASNSCTKDETPAPSNTNNQTPGDCLANGTKTAISSNHGHSMTVSKDDVNNAVEKTYDIQGTATHDHTVTITTSEFTNLQSNHSIEVSSTSASGHSHTVTVTCA